jgi:phosphoserine phosphatase
MVKKLIVFDLDGTLSPSKSILPIGPVLAGPAKSPRKIATQLRTRVE